MSRVVDEIDGGHKPPTRDSRAGGLQY